MLPLILASSSQSRKSLLARLQLPFTSISPDIDESPLPDETPSALALRLAENKARKIADDHANSIVIGSDLVIMCGDARLDKPGSIENAREQLRLASNNTVDCYAGLCVINTKTHHVQKDMEFFQVSFRQLTDTMIDNYLRLDEPWHAAGSILAESLGIALFTDMRGRDYTALLGLPLILLTDMLMKENASILTL